MIPSPLRLHRRTRLLPSVLVLTLAVATAPVAAEPAAATGPLTFADLVRLCSVRDVRIAPGGDLVAYTLQVPRRPWEEKDGPAWSELHVVDAAGNDRAFVAGEVNVGSFVWTRDGKAIAFLAKRAGDETTSLYTIARDGGEARRRLAHATDLEGFELLPDGKGVVFLAREKKSEDVTTRIEKGFDREVLALLFYPGLSLRPEAELHAGRGVGLDLTLAAVQRIGGTIAIDTQTRIQLGPIRNATVPIRKPTPETALPAHAAGVRPWW